MVTTEDGLSVAWFRNNFETFGWVILALVLVAWTYDRTRTADRAIAALKRDGYEDIELIGRSCHVARAREPSGDTVHAYSCSWD